MSKKLLWIIIGLLILIILTVGVIVIFKYLNENELNIEQYSDEEKASIYQDIINGNDYNIYLEDGKKMSFAFEDGSTPLELLIEEVDFNDASKLLENGFDLTLVENNHIDTVSNILFYNENFDIALINNIAIELVEQIKSEIENKDKDGYSLLINAIKTNNPELVTEILKYTKDIDKVYHSETALTYACDLGIDNINIIKELISKNANINYKGDGGYTCLMNAVYAHQDDLLRYLLTLDDININEQNDEGQTILHLCVEYANVNAVDIILENSNINKSIEDNKNRTAKEYALELAEDDIFSKL